MPFERASAEAAVLALFQFDAASTALLERMLAEERLPVLAELRRRGHWQPLDSTTDLFSAVYPTLYSGIDFADHGLYYHFIWSPEKQRAGYLDRFDRPELAWERMSRAGARSLVIDPYQVWKSPIGSGISFSGWQFQHRVVPSWGQPRREWLRAVSRFGRPPVLVDIAASRSTGELLTMLRVFRRGPDRTASLVTSLLGRESFDLIWVTLSSGHLAGHHLWDSSQLREGPAEQQDRRRLEGGLAEVYSAQDAALGRMIEALPAGAETVVFSPYGMDVNTSRSDLLPEMLERILVGGALPDGPGAGAARLWRFRSRVPDRLRRAANRALPGSAVRAILPGLYTRGFDWSRTRAFTLPGDHFGYVRLNIRDRERDGIVDPAEADALAEEIAGGLLTFTDENGSTAIAAAQRPQKELRGRRVELLPDLVVRWSDHPSTTLQAVASPRFGRVTRRDAGIGRSGNHVPGGWVVTLPGHSRERDLGRPPTLTDLAATAAAPAAAEDDLPGRPLFC